MNAMLPRVPAAVRNDRGATTVFFILALVMLLSFFALVVDVGAVYMARSEAQRTAEAAALAGAGMYLDGSAPSNAEVEARAREYAGKNYVGHARVAGASTAQVQVVIDEVEQRVRVTVGGSVPLHFARLFGWATMPVQAVAAARVQGAGAAKCVKPFAIPDLWDDANGNGVYDAGERYQQFDPSAPDGAATGYGSSFRDWQNTYAGDYGRLLQLTSNPGETITPSIFWPLDMGSSDANAGCTKGGAGKDGYRENICSCNPDGVPIGGEGLPLFTGAGVGQTRQGLKELYDQDPNARWVEIPGDKGHVASSDFGDWMNSPRVMKIAVFDPTQHLDFEPGAGNMVRFNNLALFWLEPVPNGGAQADFRARFLYYARGEGAGSGTLVRTLQLVE